MEAATPGVGGRLLPAQYIAEQLLSDISSPARAGSIPLPPATDTARSQRRFERWWNEASATCGPASGLRTIFDLIAMPFFGMLGFSARHIRFEDGRCRGLLEGPEGAVLALMILPWATRPPAIWRDLSTAARELGTRWAYLVAPPFVSLVEARGFATRRSIDFTFPDCLAPDSFERMMALTHAGAFARRDGDLALIESIVESSERFQARVSADLESGVIEALVALTSALAIRRTAATYEHALALVYRVLFLLFAESRGLTPAGSSCYADSYAMSTLCRESSNERPRFGIWTALASATRLSRLGCAADEMLASPFNGRLFARTSAPALESRHEAHRPTRRTVDRDAAARAALVALGSRPGRHGRQIIQYRDLGVEQLGAVYEQVLNLDLQQLTENPSPVPRRSRGRTTDHSLVRKQTGTFYTPQPLADFVVRRTLAPLVAGLSADRILELRVVDPSMGSGAFLVSACRYLANAYMEALVDEGRASASDFDEAERARVRRLVAEQCLAGVDSNPVAVHLARLSLWLAALAHGKPLSFLDHRLRVGDSLIGAGPDDLRRLAPARRPGVAARLPLFDLDGVEAAVQQGARPLRELVQMPSDSLGDVRAKEALWRRVTSSAAPLAPWRGAASLWCARWFWPAGAGRPPAPSEMRALYDALLNGDRTLDPTRLRDRLRSADAVANARRLFHWSLEFPDVFYDASGAAGGGFDAVIGNPPWEMLRRDPHRGARARAGHDRGGKGRDGGGRAAGEVDAAGREPLVRFIRESGLFPSCTRGHINLYQPFLDRAMAILRPGGRLGMVVPWGLAVDDGAEPLRRRLIERAYLETVVGLDNSEGLFPIHRGLRFMVVVAETGKVTDRIRARLGVTRAEQLETLPGREVGDRFAYPIHFTRSQLDRIGGTTLRIPDARRESDLPLIDRLTSRFPRLGEPPWSVTFGRELNATESRPHLGTHGLAVLEGKHLRPFTVRGVVAARIARAAALALLTGAPFDRPRLGYRDVSGVANSRSLIAAIIPAGTVTTHTVMCLRTPIDLERQHFLCGLFNSYVLNALVRMLMGGHLTTTLTEGLPVPSWDGSNRQRIIALLAEELSERPDDREVQGVLDAQVARLYGLNLAEFQRVVAGFPLVAPEVRDRAIAAFTRINA